MGRRLAAAFSTPSGSGVLRKCLLLVPNPIRDPNPIQDPTPTRDRASGHDRANGHDHAIDHDLRASARDRHDRGRRRSALETTESLLPHN
jgi:hypothetical protein